MAILDDIKTCLRITHTKLDADLTAKITTARAEMVRLGVSINVAQSSDPLVEEAIKTFCQYKYTDDEKAQVNYYKSWETQVDALRKSANYTTS